MGSLCPAYTEMFSVLVLMSALLGCDYVCNSLCLSLMFVSVIYRQWMYSDREPSYWMYSDREPLYSVYRDRESLHTVCIVTEKPSHWVYRYREPSYWVYRDRAFILGVYIGGHAHRGVRSIEV